MGSGDGIVYALDAADGRVLWSLEESGGWVIAAPPVMDDHVLFDAVFDEEGGLTDEMRATYREGRGREAEERLLQMGSIAANPAVRGTMVYFGTTEGVLYAFDAATAGSPSGP